MAMVRAESELRKIAIHIFARHVNVCRANRMLKQLPKALNVICRVRLTGAVIVIAPLLLGVRHATVLVPVTGQ